MGKRKFVLAAVVTGALMVSVGIVLELAEFHIIPFAPWQLWPVGVIVPRTWLRLRTSANSGYAAQRP